MVMVRIINSSLVKEYLTELASYLEDEGNKVKGAGAFDLYYKEEKIYELIDLLTMLEEDGYISDFEKGVIE